MNLQRTGGIYGEKNEIILMGWVISFAPLYEEVLFRGFLLRKLSRTQTVVFSIVWSFTIGPNLVQFSTKPSLSAGNRCGMMA
jgi:membrane protease YdiL (CAAX protease family)